MINEIEKGLTSEQAQKLLDEGYGNQLEDSRFAVLPKVVDEGRRVINNIQHSAALYLVKNIMSFFLSLITVFAGFLYPFVPI